MDPAEHPTSRARRLIVIQAKSPYRLCFWVLAKCAICTVMEANVLVGVSVESLRVYSYSRTAAVRAREALWEKDLPATAVVLLTSAAGSTVVLLAVMLLVMGETQTPESFIFDRRCRSAWQKGVLCHVVATHLSPAQRKDTARNLVVVLFESSKVDPTPQRAPAKEPSPKPAQTTAQIPKYKNCGLFPTERLYFRPRHALTRHSPLRHKTAWHPR